MTKRIVAFLLLIAISLMPMVLASCGEDEESSAPPVSGNDEGFPLEPKVWNKTITILASDSKAYGTCEIAAAEASSEPVENAFYERNQYIKENYGLTIEVELITDFEELTNAVREDFQTDLGAYQAVCQPISYMATLGVEGILYDYNQLNYIDTSKEWWDQSAVRDLTINNQLWFLAGDIIVTDDEYTWAMYFNKDLVETLGFEDPYTLVRDNRWNLDTMYGMIKETGFMHGSQMSFDPDVGDRWGMVVDTLDTVAFMLGCGQKTVVNRGDDIVMRIKEEENINTFGKVFDILLDTSNVGVADHFGPWDSGVYGDKMAIFTYGNALFMPGTISTVSSDALRNAEIHYGILPLPKRDENQEQYTTSINIYHCSTISVPKSNSDPELLDATCYALEAMAYYGKEMVTTEYYDRTLNLKRLQDDDSSEMLDIIFRNRTYDLGVIFNFSDGGKSGMLYFYTQLIMSKNNTIISHFEQRESAYQSSIDELLDALKAQQAG